MPSLSRKRLAEKTTIEAFYPSEDDPHPDVHGVLLSDEITFYATNHQLIVPFNPENLKPAAYELTVGDEYFISGEFLSLDGEHPETAAITIPPFEVAVLKTAQVLCLPRYMIARWNIRVIHAYSGLLWVGGPQVDPGWVGHLFCPIYNLSDKPVTLKLGDALAVMDFVKTTPFDKRKPDTELKRYGRPKRLFIEDYKINDLRSALFTEAGERLAEFDEAIRNLETRFITFTQISFAIFAGVIALLALSSKAGTETLVLGSSVWAGLTTAISIAALLMAYFSHVEWRVGRLVSERYGLLMANRARAAQRFLRRSWLTALAVSAFFSVAGGVAIYLISEPFFKDIRQLHVVTKSDLNATASQTSSDILELMNRIDAAERRSATAGDLEALRQDFRRDLQEIRRAIESR